MKSDVLSSKIRAINKFADGSKPSAVKSWIGRINSALLMILGSLFPLESIYKSFKNGNSTTAQIAPDCV